MPKGPPLDTSDFNSRWANTTPRAAARMGTVTAPLEPLTATKQLSPASPPADEEGKPEDAPRPRLHLLVPEQGRPRAA